MGRKENRRYCRTTCTLRATSECSSGAFFRTTLGPGAGLQDAQIPCQRRYMGFPYREVWVFTFSVFYLSLDPAHPILGLGSFAPPGTNRPFLLLVTWSLLPSLSTLSFGILFITFFFLSFSLGPQNDHHALPCPTLPAGHCVGSRRGPIRFICEMTGFQFSLACVNPALSQHTAHSIQLNNSQHHGKHQLLLARMTYTILWSSLWRVFVVCGVFFFSFLVHFVDHVDTL